MNDPRLLIRDTIPSDLDAVMSVHRLAFGYDKEAVLTASLLADPTAQPLISLLAELDGFPLGHILFTKASFKGRDDSPLMHVLAPLAVVSDRQRQGIGGGLIREGLSRLNTLGSRIVFVLGHKEYYPRYGFIPHAAKAGYEPPYPIPDDAGEYWMYQPLSAGEGQTDTGVIRCARILDRPEHWRDDDADR